MSAAKATSALSLLLLLACVSLGAHAKPQCPGDQRLVFLPEPSNCSVYYMCHASQMWEMSCGANVFNPEINVCVGRGSEWDICTARRTSTEPCSQSNNATAIIGKADNCAQYWNCSSGEATVDSNPHLVECQYPFLFNLETQSCQPYETVHCGDRWEPLDACDYAANRCQRSHCVPCTIRYGTCQAMPDGLNLWVGKEDSPYYVLCKNQRVVEQGVCQDSNGNTQFFDKVQRACVPFPTY